MIPSFIVLKTNFNHIYKFTGLSNSNTCTESV